MKKIVTAIGNPEIAQKLSKENNIEINYKDIQYKEGILEILENDNKINLIIINEKIPGKIEINLLIENILKINSQIKIYLILESKNIKIKNKNINIFNQINYEEIIKKIFEEDIQKRAIENEINLEKIPEEKIVKGEQGKNAIGNVEIERTDTKNQNIDEWCEDLSKLVVILGPENIGKSVIAVIVSFFVSKHKRVLLVDMDTENGNINTILQVKKNANKIQNISNNLDFICTENSIKNIEKNYDFIFIDNYNKNKLNENYKIIFISDGNLIGIEKSKKLLNKLNLIKIRNNILLINNYNKNSIDKKLLKNIFYEFNNVEKIKYSEKYNLIINNFNKINLNIFFNKKYKKIVQKIIN